MQDRLMSLLALLGGVSPDMVARMGRKGDTEVVYADPAAFQALRSMTDRPMDGSGDTINPRTGLTAFESADSEGTGSGSVGSGDGTANGGGDPGAASDAGVGGMGGYGDGSNTTYGEVSNPEMGGSLGRRDQNAAIDAVHGGGWAADAGRELMGLFGLEQTLAIDPMTGRFGVQTGLNPGSLVGMATGLPGLGRLSNWAGLDHIGLSVTPGSEIANQTAETQAMDRDAGGANIPETISTATERLEQPTAVPVAPSISAVDILSRMFPTASPARAQNTNLTANLAALFGA